MSAEEGAVGLVRRCAWCARVFAGGRWQAAPEEPAAAPAAVAAEHETATICPGCMEKLKRRGLSR